MGRILFFVLLAVAIWVAWTLGRRTRLNESEREELNRLRAQNHPKYRQDVSLASETTMVQCQHCGVYFPKSEAVLRGSHIFCSTRCRDQHPE